MGHDINHVVEIKKEPAEVGFLHFKIGLPRAQNHPASCRHPMFVVRALTVVENGTQRRQIGRIRIEPRVEVLRLDRDYAAIVTGSRDFWRRLVSDRSKGP